MDRSSTGDRLIERDRELDLIAAVLKSAEAGSGAGALIRSPAGMGKTALLQATGDLARQRGMQVFSARGGLLEHEFAFGVVRQLLAPVASDPALRSRALREAGAGAASVLTDDTPVPAAVPDGFFSVAYSIFWALMNVAVDAPLCLLVDDLHWADGASIKVLDFVLRRIQDAPIAIIAALRNGEPPTGDALGILPELEAEGLVDIIEPAPLSIDGVAELATRAFGSDVDPAFAAACHHRTAGSPFFAHELLRDMLSAGAVPTAATTAHVASSLPRKAGRIVVARLKRLGPDCTELARAVAILADHARLIDAAELAQLAPTRAARAAESLTAAGLLSDANPGLKYVHPLMRDAVEQDMPREIVAYWHAHAADVLAKRGRDPQMIAAHLLLAPTTADAQTVRRLQDAARIASVRAAPDEAITLLRRGLAEPPAQDQMRDVLFDLGRAEAAVGDPDAVAHLESAHHLSAGADARGEVALVLSRALMLSGRPQRVYPAVAQAQRELDDDSDELSLALQAIAFITGFMDAGQPLPLQEEVHRLAALTGRTLGERAVLACVAFDNARRGSPVDDTIQLIDRIVDRGGVAAANGADPFLALTLITAIQWCGRLTEAVRLTDDLIDYARGVNSAMVFAEALGSRAMTRWRAGALDQAEADARQSLEIEGALRRSRSPVAVAALARVLVDQGHAPQALGLILDNPMPDLPQEHVRQEIILTTLGRVQIAAHRYDDALTTLRRAGRIAEAVGTVNPTASDWRVQAAEALHALGRVTQAQQMIARAVRHARRAGGATELGPTLRIAAQIDDTHAIDLLRESAEVLRDSGLNLELARTRARIGAHLHRSGASRAAREPLELAMDVAQRCGATPLAAQARADLVAAGGRPRRWQRSGVNSLTPSERRVVDLAVGGNTNRQIAQHLFVSTRTAEAHLRNAFRKLGVTTRSDLAGLVRPETGAS